MTFSPANFVNTDIQHLVYLSVLKAVVYNIFDRLSDSIPVKPKQSADNLPGQLLSPCGQKYTQMNREGTLPLRPWNQFFFDTTGSTFNPAGLIDQLNRNSPYRYMLPLPLVEGIIARTCSTT